MQMYAILEMSISTRRLCCSSFVCAETRCTLLVITCAARSPRPVLSIHRSPQPHYHKQQTKSISMHTLHCTSQRAVLLTNIPLLERCAAEGVGKAPAAARSGPLQTRPTRRPAHKADRNRQLLLHQFSSVNSRPDRRGQGGRIEHSIRYPIQL